MRFSSFPTMKKFFYYVCLQEDSPFLSLYLYNICFYNGVDKNNAYGHLKKLRQYTFFDTE